MILRFNILSPGNTGMPDYNVCGQAASAISNVNLACEIIIAGVSIFSTTDLSSAIMPITPIVVTPTINVTAMTYGVDGFKITLDSPLIGESTTLEIKASKTGYIGYDNILDIYGFDLGNDSIVTNNIPIDIYLINETNNVVNGRQTKAFSNFTAYRRPFTNEVHYYNMVGTQGVISYDDNTSNTTLNGSERGQACSQYDIEIQQTIRVYDGSGTLLDTCTSGIVVDESIWFPTYNTTVSCEIECGDCVSDQSANNYATTEIDFSNVTPVYIDDIQVYPTSQLDNKINHDFYDFTGTLIYNQSTPIVITTYPQVFPNIIFNFNLPSLGNNILKTTYEVDNNVTGHEATTIIDCYITNIINSCSWFNITETENCGEYIVSNCSFNDSTLVVSAMQADQTFSIISTTSLAHLDSTIISLTEDNIYTISLDDGTGAKIVIINNYCDFKNCVFNYLDKLVCKTPCGDCETKSWYNFNALMINAHTYFMMLNNEYNFNFLYTTLSPAKVAELYDVKQVLDRMSEYCTTSCTTGCKTCGC